MILGPCVGYHGNAQLGPARPAFSAGCAVYECLQPVSLPMSFDLHQHVNRRATTAGFAMQGEIMLRPQEVGQCTWERAGVVGHNAPIALRRSYFARSQLIHRDEDHSTWRSCAPSK